MAIWDKVVENNSKKFTERNQNKEESRSLGQIRRHPSILKVINKTKNLPFTIISKCFLSI